MRGADARLEEAAFAIISLHLGVVADSGRLVEAWEASRRGGGVKAAGGEDSSLAGASETFLSAYGGSGGLGLAQLIRRRGQGRRGAGGRESRILLDLALRMSDLPA